MQRIDLAEIQARLDASQPPLKGSERDTPKFTAANLPPNHPLWALWSRFSEIYGHQWASQQGDEPNDTWVRGLDGLTNQQFGQGLRALLDRRETWPPNLIEFRQLCLGYGGETDWEHKRLKYFQPDALLERKRTDEEAEQGLKTIREIMGTL